MSASIAFGMIDDAIERHAESAFVFLEDLVRADSTVGREQDALEVLADRFGASGFEIERLPVPGDVVEHPAAGVAQTSYDGRYDVFARLPGRGGRSLLFNGHIDVVPPGDLTQWTMPPYEPVRRDGWLYGRGSGDMKAGFAMGWLALQAILEVAPSTITGDLALVAVIEEECTGNGTLAACQAGQLADAVVLLEPTDLDLLLAGVGVLWFEIVVFGSAGHAHDADRSASALDAALDVITGLRAFERRINLGVADEAFIGVTQPYNLNIGIVNTGDWQSSVPSSATVGVRFGFPRSWSVERAVECFQAELDDVSARSTALTKRHPQLRPNGFRAEGYALDPSHDLVDAMRRAHHAAHGTDVGTYGLGSTTDARFYLNQFGVPALCYGPRAVDIHGIDEHVELRSIVDGARTLVRFIADFYAQEAR